MYVYFLIMILW